jgi:hypothetical protein
MDGDHVLCTRRRLLGIVLSNTYGFVCNLVVLPAYLYISYLAVFTISQISSPAYAPTWIY